MFLKKQEKNSKMYKIPHTHILISNMKLGGIHMGFLNGIKKSKELNKKAEWKQGMINTVIELEEDHMNLVTATYTDTIFYKDIMNVEQVTRIVNIKTNVKTYSLTYRKMRGGTDKAQELHQMIIQKMSEKK